MIVNIETLTQTISHKDFEQILMREQIYKTPIEFHITMRIDVYHRLLYRGLPATILYLNGHEVKTKILSVTHFEKIAKIIFIHEEYYELMTNLHKSKDIVLGTTLENYISYDADCYLNFREELAKRGLIVILDNNRSELKKVHVTSWQGKEKKQIRGVFRKVDVSLKPNLSHYRENEELEEAQAGTSRTIHSFYLSPDEVRAINKKIIPLYTVIASGFNDHIYCMDKVHYAGWELCVMGIQRLTKSNQSFSSFILGRDVMGRE